MQALSSSGMILQSDAKQQVYVLRPEEGQEQDRGAKEMEIGGRKPVEAA